MPGRTYQDCVLRYLQLSRQLPAKGAKCPLVRGVCVHAVPASTAKTSVLLAAVFLSLLTGRLPAQLYKVNRRSKERFLAGGLVTARGHRALSILLNSRVLLLFPTHNFGGFKFTLPNVSVGFTMRDSASFRGLRRGYNVGAYSLAENDAPVRVGAILSAPDLGLTLLRALRLPLRSHL